MLPLFSYQTYSCSKTHSTGKLVHQEEKHAVAISCFTVFFPFFPSQSFELQIHSVSLPHLPPFFIAEDLQVSACSHL